MGCRDADFGARYNIYFPGGPVQRWSVASVPLYEQQVSEWCVCVGVFLRGRHGWLAADSTRSHSLRPDDGYTTTTA